MDTCLVFFLSGSCLSKPIYWTKIRDNFRIHSLGIGCWICWARYCSILKNILLIAYVQISQCFLAIFCALLKSLKSFAIKVVSNILTFPDVPSLTAFPNCYILVLICLSWSYFFESRCQGFCYFLCNLEICKD